MNQKNKTDSDTVKSDISAEYKIQLNQINVVQSHQNQITSEASNIYRKSYTVYIMYNTNKSSMYIVHYTLLYTTYSTVPQNK